MKGFKIIIGASALVFTTQAQAAQYLLTYTGTITTNDALGLFGPASFDRAPPRAFIANFTIDDSVPGATFQVSANSTQGYNFGPASAVITGVLTIDGRSYTFGGSEAQFFTGNETGADTISVLTGFEDDDTYTMLSFVAGYFGAPSSYKTAFSGNAPVGLDSFSAAMFMVTDKNTALTSSGNAVIARVTLAEIGGAVPEPASWALMIGGFGLTGGALRYRRRSVRAAIA